MRSIWLGVLAIVGMLFLGCAESADQSGTFRSTGDMNTARKGHTATLLNTGQVLVAGGGN
ncbi:MAG: hypothetical protein ACUVX1_01990 [Chloroflexota bacterium]